MVSRESGASRSVKGRVTRARCFVRESENLSEGAGVAPFGDIRSHYPVVIGPHCIPTGTGNPRTGMMPAGRRSSPRCAAIVAMADDRNRVALLKERDRVVILRTKARDLLLSVAGRADGDDPRNPATGLVGLSPTCTASIRAFDQDAMTAGGSS